ncbi:hypothetical protein JW921_02680 [Candidatus Fermentibacterales bacterium]|nr:hypothetical protein [Candidatus Fermentibacterales bacterium]
MMNRPRSRAGKIGLSTIAFLAVALTIVSAAWKAIDFFILGPAGVKAAMNDVHDEIRGASRHMPANRYFEEFRNGWLAYKRNSYDDIILRTSPPHEQGGRIFITYDDSIEIPALPTIRHEFSVSMTLRSW